jgi:hypothetical protein
MAFAGHETGSLFSAEVTRITWSGPKRELDSSHSHAATSEVSR